MKSSCDTLIVGAGLAGLSAAWHLRGKGNIRVVDQSHKVGGLTATSEKDGYRFDHTGHLLHLRDETIKKWVVDELFAGDIPSVNRDSRVWSWGVYTRYPFQANTFGLPQKVADECLAEYLKVLEKPPRKPVRTAEDFIYRHFGKGFAKHFMIPYNKKIWGVHPREMAASWGERFVPIPKKEEVLAGARKDSTKRLGYNSSFLYPALGMGELSLRMHEALRKHVEVEFGKQLVRVDFKKKIAYFSHGEEIHYKALVSTLPLKELLGRLVKPPKAVVGQAKKLHCQSLCYLNVGLNTKTTVPWQWCYVPSPAVPFYRVGVYSNLSKALVPRGKSSLYVELSSRRYTPAILPKVIRELKNMGVIKSKKDICFIDPHFVKYAYVIYDQEYAKVVPKLHSFLNKNSIYSIGRWGAWNYSSMEDALIMGRDVSLVL